MKIGNENFLILNYFNSTKSTDEAMEARREPETDWDWRYCDPVFSCARRKLPWADWGRDNDLWVSYKIQMINWFLEEM